MNRRTFVKLTLAGATLAGCDGLIGPSPVRDPEDDGPSLPDGSLPDGSTTPPEAGGFSDGNVIREVLYADGVPIPVEWRHPRGDATLSLSESDLQLVSARHGTFVLGPAELDIGEGPEVIARTLGPSVLAEARAVLLWLTS